MNEEQSKEQSSAIEKRKRMRFYARFTLSGIVFLVFFCLLYVLFYGELVKDGYRDIVNILIGTYVAALMKVVNYWFIARSEPKPRMVKNTRAIIDITKARAVNTPRACMPSWVRPAPSKSPP